MGIKTYDSVQHGLPTLVFIFLHGLQEHFLVLGYGHLLVDQELVARLVMGFEWQALSERWVHGVNIDVH